MFPLQTCSFGPSRVEHFRTSENAMLCYAQSTCKPPQTQSPIVCFRLTHIKRWITYSVYMQGLHGSLTRRNCILKKGLHNSKSLHLSLLEQIFCLLESDATHLCQFVTAHSASKEKADIFLQGAIADYVTYQRTSAMQGQSSFSSNTV